MLEHAVILRLVVQGSNCGAFGSTVWGEGKISLQLSLLGSTISCVVLGKHCERSSVAVRAVGVLRGVSR